MTAARVAGWRRRLPTPLGAVDTLAVPAALAAATFIAATPWLHAYDVAGTTGLLVIAAWASVMVSAVVIRVWRRPPAVSYSVSAICLILLLVAAAGFHPDEIWRSLVDGPSRLLTETLPLGGARVSLAVPLVLTWVCGAATTELVLRARRPDAAMTGAGLAVPVACFVFAYAVVSSRPGRSEVAGPLLLVTLVLVAVLRHVARVATVLPAGAGAAPEVDARPATWRPGVAGALTAAALAVVLALLVPNLPAMSQTPASLNRAAPLAMAVVTDPVNAMAQLRDGTPRTAPRPLLRVAIEQPSTGYLGMAVLDHYDGGIWSFNTTFEPTGGRVPSPPAGTPAPTASAPVVSVRQRTTILASLPVPLLPALDRPVRVAGVDAVVDGMSGMLLSNHLGRTTTYSVVSSGPSMTLGSVPQADGVGTAAGLSSGPASADLALPAGSQMALGTALRFLSTITGQRPAPTVAFLQAAMNSLHAVDRRVDPNISSTTGKPTATTVKRPASRTTRPTLRRPTAVTKPAGTSLAGVISAVTISRSATPEQFATFFAMIARYLGVPARVVTGFRTATSSGGAPVAAGDHTLTNRQAWTWVEIPVSGLGWVVADPTPNAGTPVPAQPAESVQAAPTTLPQLRANAVPISRDTGGHAVAKPAPIVLSRPHPLPGWVVALLIGLGVTALIAALGPGLAAARRLSRRRARRRGDAPALVVGAWLELLDSLQQAGMAAGRGDTSAEVAEEAGRHFGPEVTLPVLEVGDMAERAVFSVSDPPGPDDASEVWATQRSVRKTVHGGLDRRRRWRALLSVGSSPKLAVTRLGHRPARVGTASR
jgi:hypothetical protein